MAARAPEPQVLLCLGALLARWVAADALLAVLESLALDGILCLPASGLDFVFSSCPGFWAWCGQNGERIRTSCGSGLASDRSNGAPCNQTEDWGLETVVVGEVHENTTLHCGNISEARGLVTWYRNDSEPIFLLSSNSSRPPAKPRFSLVNASSLHIEALSLQDEGNYTCWEALNDTRWFQVWLQVASGPYQVEVNISSTGVLPNGTLYATQRSRVDFSCASSSRPPPMIEWWFRAPDSKTEPFGNNLTVSSFTLLLMSQNLQGNYTCVAKNLLSGRQRSVTTELLVYTPPPLSDFECWAEMLPRLFMLQLTCRWNGGYPDPNLLWTEEPGGVVVGTSKLGVEMLNRSQLSDGKKFKCVGSHIAGPESGASCVVQIRAPSLLSEPMKTCFVGGNVTFTCLVSGAYPSAKILWLRNLTQPEVAIQPSSHYLITQKGQSSTLTIHNCSQDLDEGYYVCRAENPVGVREVAIWLSVKEPLNIVGIVGTIVSLLLLGLAIISGLMLYYSPVFCWKWDKTWVTSWFWWMRKKRWRRKTMLQKKRRRRRRKKRKPMRGEEFSIEIHQAQATFTE
ncbi:V-set and immunoglobulin domain-containing protein 10 isoform X1 [Myotis lucifugus]|uniref:V-set and immunoglobulin domain-containing protein 10 isoform X1 n=1 Tax=Myotis lucifugus TaxID=59463 RepID=UPI000CCBE718|nr:V-set and immunoglobulin domain-containing protein 10 isoform X1 [Myotis lucifugus]